MIEEAQGLVEGRSIEGCEEAIVDLGERREVPVVPGARGLVDDEWQGPPLRGDLYRRVRALRRPKIEKRRGRGSLDVRGVGSRGDEGAAGSVKEAGVFRVGIGAASPGGGAATQGRGFEETHEIFASSRVAAIVEIGGQGVWVAPSLDAPLELPGEASVEEEC